MSARQRRKGRVGQSRFRKVLEARGYTVDQITAGVQSEDLIATDLGGRQWSVEVKNTRSIVPGHLTQAREQAAKRKLPWMLANRIDGTTCWLVRCHGVEPMIWNEESEEWL